jgi:hypothetical protein
MRRLLFLLLMTTCSVSWAEWTFYLVNEKEGEYVLIDRDRIKRDGSFARMWQMSKYDKVQKDVWGLFDEETVLVQYDCVNERSIVLDLKYRRNGTLIFSANTDNARWSYHHPGTRGFGMLEIACGKK